LIKEKQGIISELIKSMDLIRNIENLLKFKIKVEAQSLKIGEE
jgi:hypothetical protein